MTPTQRSCWCDAPKELTTAQTVFDCDDLKKEIFSYCLPQYPIVTKDMIDDQLLDCWKWSNTRKIASTEEMEIMERKLKGFPHYKADRYEILKGIRLCSQKKETVARRRTFADEILDYYYE